MVARLLPWPAALSPTAGWWSCRRLGDPQSHTTSSVINRLARGAAFGRIQKKSRTLLMTVVAAAVRFSLRAAISLFPQQPQRGAPLEAPRI